MYKIIGKEDFAAEGSHIHFTEGYVLCEKGHNHYYKAYLAPAISVIYKYP
jgi:hypothetical protein